MTTDEAMAILRTPMKDRNTEILARATLSVFGTPEQRKMVAEMDFYSPVHAWPDAPAIDDLDEKDLDRQAREPGAVSRRAYTALVMLAFVLGAILTWLLIALAVRWATTPEVVAFVTRGADAQLAQAGSVEALMATIVAEAGK